MNFTPQITEVRGAYDGKYNNRNPQVPAEFSIPVVGINAEFLKKFETIPEAAAALNALREHFWRIEPFGPMTDNGLFWMTTLADKQVALYIVDPVDDKGVAYYQGQGYVPHCVLVFRNASTDGWQYLKV